MTTLHEMSPMQYFAARESDWSAIPLSHLALYTGRVSFLMKKAVQLTPVHLNQQYNLQKLMA
jgi:hypothetical protein